MELTKEDFEHILSKQLELIATKQDIVSLADSFDRKLDEQAHHFDQKLAEQNQHLAQHFDSQLEELAKMTAQGFEDLQERLDVRDQLLTFERKFKKLEEALHLTL